MKKKIKVKSIKKVEEKPKSIRVNLTNPYSG